MKLWCQPDHDIESETTQLREYFQVLKDQSDLPPVRRLERVSPLVSKGLVEPFISALVKYYWFWRRRRLPCAGSFIVKH